MTSTMCNIVLNLVFIKLYLEALREDKCTVSLEAIAKKGGSSTFEVFLAGFVPTLFYTVRNSILKDPPNLLIVLSEGNFKRQFYSSKTF